MPCRSSKYHDFTTVARRVVEQAIGDKMDGSPLDDPHKGKNPASVALAACGKGKVSESGPGEKPQGKS
ncbi:MAG: hypothetical protein ACR2NN_00520 [Bryobacteraceae bacterium]